MEDKILIITDDDSLLDALGGHLAQWGAAVLSARGAGEAQRILARERAPLVILDDSPAGDDSLALLSQLRCIHSWAQTVFLAAPRDMERGAKALELGASDFLVKPVSASRLAVALKRAQERLIVNTKLAVLSGEVLDGAPPQQVDAAEFAGQAASTFAYAAERHGLDFKSSIGERLGLFIANDTVLQHGGSIIVDSEPGQGAHFHVRIPERPRTSLED